jgi:hypothetical protein
MNYINRTALLKVIFNEKLIIFYNRSKMLFSVHRQNTSIIKFLETIKQKNNKILKEKKLYFNKNIN